MVDKYISVKEKQNYFERLIIPYKAKEQTRFFIEQYIKGDGKELSKNFWNVKSSSRMAFDLYSWIAKCPKVIDFSFEYKLPRLKSGGNGPNMDVFIETEDEIIFIESKFSEKANLNYKNGHLPKAYYSEEPHGKKSWSLYQRYYDYELICNEIIKFINDVDEFLTGMPQKDSNCEWFYPKQETCHLIGIIFMLLGIGDKHIQQSILKGKELKFYNVFWKFDDDKEDSYLAEFFKSRALELFDKIPEFNNVKFIYETLTVQDLLSNKKQISKNIVFNDEIKLLMNPYFEVAKNQTRMSMQNK